MSVAVRVEKDTATPLLQELLQRLKPQEIAEVAAGRAVTLVKRNFRKLGTNARGWPTTHFWERAQYATTDQPGNGFHDVLVAQQGVRQRLLGGLIRPVNKQALTIPISPVSYGHTVSDFPGAFLLCTAKGAWIVQYGTGGVTQGTKAAEAKASRALKGNWKERRKANLNFLFVLSKGVTQTANSKVMPSDEEFGAEFDRAIKGMLRKADGGQEG